MSDENSNIAEKENNDGEIDPQKQDGIDLAKMEQRLEEIFEKITQDDIDEIHNVPLKDDNAPNWELLVRTSGTVPRFQQAYNHAMNVLDNYIERMRKKQKKAKEQGRAEVANHYYWKVFFMNTAKGTIEENIKVYLEHPELYDKK